MNILLKPKSYKYPCFKRQWFLDAFNEWIIINYITVGIFLWNEPVFDTKFIFFIWVVFILFDLSSYNTDYNLKIKFVSKISVMWFKLYIVIFNYFDM